MQTAFLKALAFVSHPLHRVYHEEIFLSIKLSEKNCKITLCITYYIEILSLKLSRTAKINGKMWQSEKCVILWVEKCNKKENRLYTKKAFYAIINLLNHRKDFIYGKRTKNQNKN